MTSADDLQHWDIFRLESGSTNPQWHNLALLDSRLNYYEGKLSERYLAAYKDLSSFAEGGGAAFRLGTPEVLP